MIARRTFFALVGGATTAPALMRPTAARAQQAARPVIGFLDPNSPDTSTNRLRGFRLGLKEAGYVEGENVAIEHRWAENQNDRLPALAADLVRRRVAVIVTAAAPAAFAAKAATTTIPVVFGIAQDPVELGLVASLPRPGGNLTGINFLTTELAAKRLALLRELVPGARRVAVLVNPANPTNTRFTLREVETAARTMELQFQIFEAASSREIDLAFAALARAPTDALFVGSGPFFGNRRIQLAQWAAHSHLPATYGNRDFPEAGGLMSYGSNTTDAFRQAGLYAGRILKGAKPADLPVVQASRFELVINHQTARMLGLAVPTTLLATADEVIE